jgi:cAMP phosphodiesterase
MAKVTVLGAFGTKGENSETTCIALNDKHVMDAGNLIKGLQHDCVDLETIWLTHSHLDHIVDIAFVLDCFFEERNKPLKIAALPETIKILQKHIFNELIWPDFSKIKLNNSEYFAMEYVPIEIGKRYEIGPKEYIEPFETNHTVPSCGYILTKKNRSLMITADTYKSDTIWDIINSRDDIHTILIECSFPSALDKLAKESKHLTPKLLGEEVEKLTKEVEIYINHIKESGEEIIKEELMAIPKLRHATIVHDFQRLIF